MTQPPEQPPAKTFTQAELDGIVQREKSQAKAAEERRIAELLGISPADAKARLDKAAADEAATLSAAEAAKREADTAKAAADKTLAEARLLRRDTLAEQALVRAGFQVPADDEKGEALAYGVRLLAGVPADADAAAIGAEVASLKTRLPGLFTAAASADEEVPRPFGGHPSSDTKPPARPGTPEAPWGAAGLERARQRGLVKDTATA